MAEEHRTRRHGAFLATAHAGFMHKQGLLSKSELEDVRKAALANHLETMSEDDKYHPAHIDRMRADAGPGDGEDQDEVTARRADAVTKVAAHLHGHAVMNGHLSPEEAMRTLASYVDLPKNTDPERVIAGVMEVVHSGERLPRADEANQPDPAEVDAYIEGRYGKRR